MPRRLVEGAGGRLSLILVASALGILVAPVGAAGQDSALDQYIPSAKPRGTGQDDTGTGVTPGGGGDGSAGAGTTGAPATPAVGAGSGGGGEVPGSDYPITPFVAIVALLLVAGLLLRVFWPALGQRVRPR